MNQGREFTARRKTIREEEQVKKGRMRATRDVRVEGRKVSATTGGVWEREKMRKEAKGSESKIFVHN